MSTHLGPNSSIGDSPLLTDLYQLAMLQAYFEHGMEQTAVFEFFVRKMPAGRNFLIAAGLEQLLEFLEEFRFGPAELEWLRESGRFSGALIDRLADLRFTGEVHALPEGTLFFPDEPVVRVTAPLPEAQVIESRLINILHLQTLIASKAVRCVLAAPGRQLVDFGLRRAHGAEAALLAARATYLAGFDGSATVLAGARFGIPLFGTMAHSYVEAHDDERAAFASFAASRPDNLVLLIDTYDTEAGAAKVVELVREAAARGLDVRAVRIDSGDLADHARRVRAILDEGGLRKTRVFASGGLDEHQLHEMVAGAVPVDGFGIGTLVDTSADAPYLDSAYKLVEYAGRARRKHSEEKATWPGCKQVFRSYDADDWMTGDTVIDEPNEMPGEPILRQVMRGGRRTTPAESLERIRTRVREGVLRLPAAWHRLDPAPSPYPVTIAPSLKRLAEEVDRTIASNR